MSTQAELARRLGVSGAMVTKHKQQGKLVYKADGSLDIEGSMARIASESAPDRGGKGGGPRAPVAPATAAAAPAAPSANASFAQARAAREAYSAKSAELDLLERMGQLVAKNMVERALVDALGPVLSRLASLSTRIAQHVGEDDRRRVQTAVDNEVGEIRREIAEQLRTMIAGGLGQTRQ